MNKMYMLLKSLFIYPIVVSLSLYAIPLVKAEDTTTNPGNVGVVGPTLPVGPTGQTGPTKPTGPQEVVASEATTSSASATNSGTGASSQNTNNATSTATTDVAVENKATLNNSVGASLNTGKNNVAGNTAAGNVTTGTINGAVNVLNVANSNFAPGSSVGTQSIDGTKTGQVTLAPSTNRSDLGNSNSLTGASSKNTNANSSSNAVNLVQVNQANATNQLAVDASTGNNTINHNTQVGDLQTGDINLVVNLVNMMNVNMPDVQMNVDVWSILANPDTTISVGNELTGANSENTNTTELNNQKNIQISQNANLNNDIGVNSSTGSNTVNQNTSAGAISTGSAKVNGSLVNIANATEPTFYVVNVFGPWSGALQGIPSNSVVINHANDTTGVNSQNTNNTSNDYSINGSVQNSASANNKVMVNATTGGNTLSKNTELGSVKTGNVSVLANVVNILNSWDSRAKTFRLGIINIFSKPVATQIVNPSINKATTLPSNETIVSDSTPVGVGQAMNMAKNLSRSATDSNKDKNVYRRTSSTYQSTKISEYNQMEDQMSAAVTDTNSTPPSSVVASIQNTDSEEGGDSTKKSPYKAYAAVASDNQGSEPIGRSTSFYVILAGLLAVWIGLEIAAKVKSKSS